MPSSSRHPPDDLLAPPPSESPRDEPTGNPERPSPAAVEDTANRAGGSPGNARRPPPLTWKARLALLALGCALVLAVEGLCRLAGFGGLPPLWRAILEKDGGAQQLLELDPAAMTVFFSAPTRSGLFVQGEIRPHRILVPKPDRLRRVLVVGESSVQGFPWPRNLSFSAFMESELRRMMPGQPVEVINLGMTAAASFVVREIARQSIESLDADLLVVYTGHNEFFGAFGVASMQFGGANVSAMRALYVARTLGIYQAMERLVRGSKRRERRPGESVRLIEEMAGRDNIPPGGPLHERAAAVLDANLTAIVRHARRHEVPVLLVKLAANESGIVPIMFYDEDRDLAARVAEEAKGLLLDEAMTPAEGIARCDDLARRHPHHAMVPYVRAKFLDRAGRFDEAITDYQRAIDLDAMPWRAPSSTNAVIRAVGAREGIALLDLPAALHRATGKPIGFDLMIDHLHPSLEGQMLIGHELALAALPLLAGQDSASGERAALVPATEAATRRGANHLEEAAVTSRAAGLFTTPPLGVNNAHVTALLQARVQKLLAATAPPERAAIQRWNHDLAATGRPAPISLHAGEEWLRAGHPEEAGRAFAAAAMDAPGFSIDLAERRALALLSYRLAGPLSEERRALVGQTLGVLDFVATFAPEAERARIWTIRGWLLLAAGDHAQAREALRRAGSLDHRIPEVVADAMQHIILDDERQRGEPDAAP